MYEMIDYLKGWPFGISLPRYMIYLLEKKEVKPIWTKITQIIWKILVKLDYSPN